MSDFTFSLGDPAQDAFAVTPNDGADLPQGACQALYIGVAGDVTVVMKGGGTVLFKAVPVGVLRIRAARVKATATTATNIVALYT